MSEKEYKVEYHNDHITLKEVKYDDTPAETNPNPTFREEMGEKIRSTSKPTKIILTLLFNIYGILYRFGCNKTSAVIFSFCHFTLSIIAVGILIAAPYSLEIFIPIAIVFLIQLIDLISIIATGDIVFLKMKKYKNYWER